MLIVAEAGALPGLGSSLIGAAAANLVFGTVLWMVLIGKLNPPYVHENLRSQLEDEKKRSEKSWQEAHEIVELYKDLYREQQRTSQELKNDLVVA